MPEKVTKEEKLLELAIAKAKEVLQEANVNTMEIDEPLTGEEVKVKKPKENPKEVPLPKTSNIEGKENKISKTSKEILKAPFDTAPIRSLAAEQNTQKLESSLEEILDNEYKLEQSIMQAGGKKNIFLTVHDRHHNRLTYEAGGQQKLEEFILQAYNLAEFSISEPAGRSTRYYKFTLN